MAEQVERRLAAILSSDVFGYTRLMCADGEGTLARLRAQRTELIDPKVAENWGHIVKLIETNGGTVHIPSQSNVQVRRVVDLKIYRHRNLVERFFNKLKHFRRIATRFDKPARNYLAAVTLASIRLWMRHYEPTT